MGAIPWDLAVVVGAQSALGTVNATIRDLNAGDGSGTAGAFTPADGLVLGDRASGEGDSGVDISFAREFVERVDLSNFTKQPSDFLRQAVDSARVTFPVIGNGSTAPGATDDTAYTPFACHDALLQSIALAGSGWGSGDGWSYVPAPVVYVTAKVFLGQRTSDSMALAWVLQDCVGSGSIVWTPGGKGLATIDLNVGSLAAFGGDWPDYEEVFPTLEYGNLATKSAPTVEGVAHAWGATRGFQTFTLNVTNTVEEIGDSNQDGGIAKRISDRNISASAVLWSDDTDLDYEIQELKRATAPTDLLSFTVGDPAAVASGLDMLAHRVRLTTPEARSLRPRRLGDSVGWEMELQGVSGSANGEFELIYL